MSAPAISVLLPTRARPAGMRAAVNTLADLAVAPDDLQFLFRMDNDDPLLDDYLSAPPLKPLRDRAHSWCGPRLGYARMHDYYNGLATRAGGRLLFVWNDDTEMLTKGWDRLLLDAVDDRKPLVQFIRRDTCATADDTFPVIDRRIFEAVGRLSGHCYVDTWLSKVAEAAGVRRFRDDIVFHHHRLTDQTQTDNAAALRSGEGHDKWFGMDGERASDAAKIKELLERLDKESGT